MLVSEKGMAVVARHHATQGGFKHYIHVRGDLGRSNSAGTPEEERHRWSFPGKSLKVLQGCKVA